MKNTKPKTFVQLGRFGDLLNIFPVLNEAATFGPKPTLVVSEEFASVCEGITYADVKIFPGPERDIRGAMAFARQLDPSAICTQLTGNDWNAKHHFENFQRDSWNRAGAADRWEQTGLVIDNRDFYYREQNLIEGVIGGAKKPILLVSLKGHSSPFVWGAALKSHLQRELGKEFFIVDLAEVKADRIFDLLGLYDQAACLVTTDTATLHLATASSIPVVALTNPDPWLGSARRANHIYHANYHTARPEEIIAAVRSTVRIPETIQKLVHVYPVWPMSEPDQKRYEVAKRSWDEIYTEGNWIGRPVDHEKEGLADATAIGDKRKLPLVRNVLSAGMKLTENDDDIIVLTNTDVGFTPGLTKKLKRLVSVKGAVYGYRFDHEKIEAPLSYEQTVSGKWFGGLDFFAFNRKWIREIGSPKLPNCYMGATDWDLLYRDVIKQHGGGEIYGAIWHEIHKSAWKEGGVMSQPVNIYNRGLRDRWTKQGGDTNRPFKGLK